ncbi:MAG TPA: hypothetical protein VK068_06400 [Jeotgalicoccus sp.]|nr:hypothetical protein [Jeotgalicoccus sp.]
MCCANSSSVKLEDNETYNRIVELYQDEDTSEFIIEHHKGASIPTKLPLSEIGW